MLEISQSIKKKTGILTRPGATNGSGDVGAAFTGQHRLSQ